MNENEQSYRGTPATEFPPTSFSAMLSNQQGKSVKKDGGESDARDLASELFMAGKTPEEGIESAIKDSSLNGSLESLEHDQQQHHDR